VFGSTTTGETHHPGRERDRRRHHRPRRHNRPPRPGQPFGARPTILRRSSPSRSIRTRVRRRPDTSICHIKPATGVVWSTE
jgi:hypothetical protein